MPRRILVLSYFYPPVPSVGSNRWGAMVSHLRALGHDVTVVTTAAYGAVDGEAGVVRTSDLVSVSWIRRAFRRGELPAQGRQVAPARPAPGVLTKLMVPDVYAVTWAPAALAAGLRVARARPVDCVITSTPYESAHLVGLALRRAGPAWVADFRDGWCFEPHRPPFPTAAQESLDRRLERAVVRGADVVLAATRPIAEDFRRRLGIDAAYVPNGWDPSRHGDGPAPAPAEWALGERFTFVHTGKLSGIRGREPRPLFAALRALVEDDPQLAGRVQLLLAGNLDSEDAAALAESGLDGIVRHVGFLPHADAEALQRRADALVLLTSSHASEVTGKLCEYLASGRPILALAEGNEAARIVTETGTGVVVPPRDVGAIAAALRRAVAGELAGEYSPRGVERYVYPAPATAVAEQVESAIARRSAA